MKTAKDEIDGLVKQREDLAAGIAQEAVEEDMGVIERAQRDQPRLLDAQIQAKNDVRPSGGGHGSDDEGGHRRGTGQHPRAARMCPRCSTRHGGRWMVRT